MNALALERMTQTTTASSGAALAAGLQVEPEASRYRAVAQFVEVGRNPIQVQADRCGVLRPDQRVGLRVRGFVAHNAPEAEGGDERLVTQAPNEKDSHASRMHVFSRSFSLSLPPSLSLSPSLPPSLPIHQLSVTISLCPLSPAPYASASHPLLCPSSVLISLLTVAEQRHAAKNVAARHTRPRAREGAHLNAGSTSSFVRRRHIELLIAPRHQAAGLRTCQDSKNASPLSRATCAYAHQVFGRDYIKPEGAPFEIDTGP